MMKCKRIIKLVLCAFLYHVGLVHLYIRSVLSKREHYPVVIINYHRFVESLDGIIEDHPSVTHCIDDFQREIEFLKKYFSIISLDEAVMMLESGKTFNAPTIVLTVDDGYKDNYDLLWPVLKETKTPATIFLSTSVIGTENVNWYDQLGNAILNAQKDTLSVEELINSEHSIKTIQQKRSLYCQIVEKLKELEIGERDRFLNLIEKQVSPIEKQDRTMLSWEEVKEMDGEFVSFGAHTHTHPILTNMPIDDAKNDIIISKNLIEEKLGHGVDHFAYPNGRASDFNDILREYCKEIGFKSIGTFEFGSNMSSKDNWRLKRIGPETPISLFAVNVLRAFCQRGNDGNDR